MSRTARKISKTGIYHIMLRGTDRRAIFLDEEDNLFFLHALRETKKLSGFKLYSYCLMGNHVHLLLEEGEERTAQIIKRLGVRYVSFYNSKYDLLGHLFQDRYRSEPVETDSYFLELMKYIFQNPVKAGLTTDPLTYRWLECGRVKAENDLVDDVGEYTSLSREELLDFFRQNVQHDYKEIEKMGRITDGEAIKRMVELCGCNHVLEIAGWEKEKRNRAIKGGLQAGISIRQFSRITGISKAVIEKTIKTT